MASFAEETYNIPQAEDIYPLGQGRGLMADIINFGLNNLYQYGQQAASSNRRLGQGMTGLATGTPGAAEALSPMIQDAIGNNPILAGVWGPIRGRGQKQAVRALWRQDPEQVMAVQADPRTLNLRAEGGPGVAERARVYEESGLMPAGATAVYNPGQSLIKVAPATLRGGHYEAPILQEENISSLRSFIESLGPDWAGRNDALKRLEGGFITKPGGTTNLPQSMLHESQHFLNEPRLYQGKPTPESMKQTQEMFGLLAPYVDTPYIEAATSGAVKYKDPRIAIDELLAYLSGSETRFGPREAAGKHLHDLLKTRTGPEGNTALRLTPQMLKNAISLAESMANPALNPKAIEIWDQLAAQGKVGSRTATFQPGQKAFKDLDFTSMARRTEPAPMYERLPRAGRTFTSAEDIVRGQAGENLPALGSAMPDIPRPVSSPGALDAFENLRAKLGLEPADLGGMAPEFYGKTFKPELEARFRDVGMKRIGSGGPMNPSEYRAEIEAQPGYQRFIDLLRNTQIGPKLGKEFETYRGMEASDPFMQAILGKGQRPSATATTPDPALAKQFGVSRSELEPGYVIGGKTTPEGVVGMVPKRGGTGFDATELIIDPNKMRDVNILAEYPPYEEVLNELNKMKRTGAPEFPEVTRENLAAHLGLDESQLEKLYNAIPFGSDTLYGAEARGRGPAMFDKYANNPLERLIEKMGLGSNVGFDFLPPLGGGKRELESKRGGKVLDELYRNWQDRASSQRVNARGDPIGPPRDTHITKDEFMQEVMTQLAVASGRSGPFPGISQGITGFRRQLAPVENMQQYPIPPLSKGKTLDILGHLDEHGLMEPQNLEKALARGTSDLSGTFPLPTPAVDPRGLDRIKRMLERVQYDPVTGGTKGKAAGELESRRGGEALQEILNDWKVAQNQFTGNEVIPKDRFMDTVLGALARATQRRPSPEGPQGFSGFRRSITTGENRYNMGTAPHDAQKSLDILGHLRDYGMLEEGVLEEALKSISGVPERMRGHEVDPAGLIRLKKLLERTGR